MNKDLPPTFTAELRGPKEGRRARNIGILFLGVAALLFACWGVPSLVRAARQADRVVLEQRCRARITGASAAVDSTIIRTFANLTQAPRDGDEHTAGIAALAAATRRSAQLEPIITNFVNICRQDPSYQLPPAP
jgi:hypothetical protein